MYCTTAGELSKEDIAWLQEFERKRAERLAQAAATPERPYKDWSTDKLKAAVAEFERERNEQMNKVLNEHKRSKEQISILIQQIRAKQQHH